MADINPSAENVRAMLTETLGRLRKASEEYFGLLEKGLSSSPLPIADQAKQFCDFNAAQRICATFNLGNTTGKGKGHGGRPQDAVRFLSKPDAGADRSGHEHGRNRDEGSDRGVYTKQIGKLRGGDGTRWTRCRAAASRREWRKRGRPCRAFYLQNAFDRTNS